MLERSSEYDAAYLSQTTLRSSWQVSFFAAVSYPHLAVSIPLLLLITNCTRIPFCTGCTTMYKDHLARTQGKLLKVLMRVKRFYLDGRFSLIYLFYVRRLVKVMTVK